ncbi:MAG: leucine-rich repeat protein, partial [Acholeplasmataceae bacterium]|nr:leucine-rich repeat protein [Acholeplasmataceae bacterium]
MKKVQLIFLIILMSIALLGCEYVKYYQTDKFDLLNFNHGISILGYREGYHSEDLVIHDEITFFNAKTGKNQTVIISAIDTRAFQNMNLRSVVIIASDNSEFNTILSYAFADNENLASVILPQSIAQVNQYAFANNPKLESIDLHDL